ncbi:Uncharacterized membrane protein [Pseudarcicella hirudinis]|uniref:Uncharacterized membrane protein n=1 Tax=Pseudarcicella hirudinis TaxID=1079859 RepID=A0A1I5VDP0_9BACT|nr:c-type cytochrome domain-containing protein [Pseudarcicella hirudinis]SFQ05664.1 Uncharacterized membrane protein [Pseudarcicella hirudinis]
MKFKVKSVAENILFASNIFILFLVFFQEKVVLPNWLQAVGRMHPMFLHFPIVILLIAMFMEFFRFRPQNISQEHYRNFSSNFLLLGSLSASVTVIMGLMLSKESGYTGDTVFWHKWTGIGIVFIASFVYWYRNEKWYKESLAKISALITAVCLMIAGHLGANITHGEDFIFAPLMSHKAEEMVSIDKAEVFAHVIKPILEKKCQSCHNPEKAKGGLLLDTPENILKGGKTGKLFLAGKPNESLILQRIHLPEEDKKHMPVAGKPQLSKIETDLIYWWIKSGAVFNKKVLQLSEKDTLRILAAKILVPVEKEEEHYDFASADEKTIEKLSNNYRVIYPLAQESPALEATFYNKTQYSSKALEELLELKKQVVELNLNKMPVKDADLKTIAQFENLRTLNLNFTDINGEGLSHLTNLKFLKSLSVSGTKVSLKSIQALKAIKSLREVFVWSTGLSVTDIAQLQKQSGSQMAFIAGYKDDGKSPMKLNTPIVLNKTMVFSDTMHLVLKHPIPGVEIRYTLDGSNPDSVKSPVFRKELVLNQTTLFKAKAYKKSWYGSDSIVYNFYKSSYKPDSIALEEPAVEKYSGDDGVKTLINGYVGNIVHNDGKWLGFQNKDMEVKMQFLKPIELQTVSFHFLSNLGSEIYPPVEVQVWGGKDKNHLKLLKTIKPNAPVKGQSAFSFMSVCNFPKSNVEYLKLVAVSVKKEPSWGNQPNKPGWLFVDEILLN